MVTSLEAAKAPAKAHSGGYGTYLGTIPGFAEDQSGALVREVQPGSPALDAGLRAGDVIVGMDGAPIADLRALAEALRAHAPGDVVALEVVRDGETVRLEATLAAPR